MVCGPKIHLREGSLLPRGERERCSTAQSSEHDDETGLLDRVAAVLCTGSVSKVHTFILESGKVSYKVPPGKTRPLAYVAKLCV